MRRLALIMLLALAAPARAADAPPAIRSFPIATIERLGREMARQDAAAWVATDALRPRVPDPGAVHLRGWIVEDSPSGQRVRFLRDDGHGLEVAYDVDVTPELKTTVSEPEDRRLAAEEVAKFAAWTTAAKAMAGQPVCRPGYNHIVLKDPEGDGWLVWLLAPMTELGSIPLGGHYRFTVSGDGHSVERRDALSASCAIVPKPDESKGEPVMNFVTHIVSPTPVETHVFLQLQSGRPMAVGAGEHLWTIVEGHVEDRGLIKDLAAEAGRK